MSLPYLSDKETAAVIRRVLKKSFPSIRFSARTGRGAGVSSVHVRWTDGPTLREVEALIGNLTAGHFDGMTDSYDYDRSRFVEIEGVLYRPGCKYVFTNRDLTPAFVNPLIKRVAEYWGGVEVVPVAIDNGYGTWTLDRVNGRDIMHDGVREDLHGPHYSWCSCIHRASENPAEFVRETV